MDPVTVVVTALAAGAAAAANDVAAQAIKDGYAALKALIIKKFGSKPDVTDAVQKVEQEPDSPGRQETLKEELTAAGADKDQELLRQAQALQDLLRQYNVTGGRNVNVGRDVIDSIIVTGDNNEIRRWQ